MESGRYQVAISRHTGIAPDQPAQPASAPARFAIEIQNGHVRLMVNTVDITWEYKSDLVAFCLSSCSSAHPNSGCLSSRRRRPSLSTRTPHC